MKKILFALSLAVCCIVSAKDIKDTWFETFVEAARNNLPKGTTMRHNDDMRIIFIDFPLPFESARGFDVKIAHAEAVKALKGSTDADFIKKAEIILIYNYITTDSKIFSVVISKKDL